MKEHDLVVLTHSSPEHGLEAGDIGTIVHCYADDAAFEVEFTSAEARTIAVLTLERNEVRQLEEGEILHARRLPVTSEAVLASTPPIPSVPTFSSPATRPAVTWVG
jgi:hypothetical protein